MDTSIVLKDPSFEKQNLMLLFEESVLRNKLLSKVHYNLTMAMPANRPYFRGHFEVKFEMNAESEAKDLFLDFQGQEISHIKVNDQSVASDADVTFLDHRIKVQNEALLQKGKENTIEFVFENTYVDNSAGLHRYVDPKDKPTYIFSHCEPYFCRRWFPCFDQPSVRATLDLKVLAPAEDWHVVANAKTKEI
jgi:aminopeptidase N